MTMHRDEHDRTLAFAEIALGQIKALRHPAAPRNYDVWYNYATGYNPSLNQTINEALASRGTLSQADIEQIHAKYISPVRATDNIESVGNKFVEEIDQVMSMIEAAVGSTSQHTVSLADATQQLGAANDRDAIRAIVEVLVLTAKDMERSNGALDARLKSSRQEIAVLQQSLEAVRTESLTDPLTTLSNRKYFGDALDRLIASSQQTGEPLSLLLSDIDHFKNFNDTYGHITGDQVLRLVASVVKQNVKGQDIAARYGGEEFVVVLPKTALREATTVADHIRRAVMGKELMKRSTGEHLGRVTVSIGVASLRPGESAQSLIERADICLYAGKRNGRNKVVCETDPEATAPEQASAKVA